MELAMNHPTNPKHPEEAFLEALALELAAVPDAEILEGVDAGQVLERGKQALAAAKKEAGRRRLQRAKSALAAREFARDFDAAPVSAAEARAFLAQAANDPRYTLAARKLDEMSDEDVLRLYRQAKRLDVSDND